MHAAMEAVHATADALAATLEHMKVVEEMRRTLREIRRREQARFKLESHGHRSARNARSVTTLQN